MPPLPASMVGTDIWIKKLLIGIHGTCNKQVHVIEVVDLINGINIFWVELLSS